MATVDEIASGRIISIDIRGQDVLAITRKISIRESICQSYLSGEVTIFDHNQFINAMQLVGLDPVNIVFDAPDPVQTSEPYVAEMYILSIAAQATPTNIKSTIFTISVVSGEYFTDRGNIITESTSPGITGVDLSQKIWNACAFPVSLITPVTDTPLQEGSSAFHIDMQHPFTAIAQIRDSMNFPQYPSGNVLLFRDRWDENLVPLEHLFATAPVQEYFEQRSTWGKSLKDMFEMSNMVIEAKSQSRGSGTTGLGGGGQGTDVTATGMQGIKKFDVFKGKLENNMVFPMVASALGGLSSVAQTFSAYGLGGAPNFQSINTNNREQATDFTAKTIEERAYASMVKAGPQYNIVVPLKTGINCTVGKKAAFNLLPDGGDQWRIGEIGKPPEEMLITDLIHDVYQDKKILRGVTTLQVMAGLQ